MRYFLILFIIYSCQNNNKKNSKTTVRSNKSNEALTERKISLQEKDTIFFGIRNDTNYFSWYTEVLYQNDCTYLCRLEYFSDRIELYNYNTLKLSKTINLKTEGPNSVRDLQAGMFHFYTKDSFLFANRHSEVFWMLNDSVIKKSVMSKPNKHSILFGDNAMKMVVSENKIFLRHVEYAETSSEEFLKGSILLSYDLLSDKSELCNISLHKKYSLPKYKNLNANFKNAVYSYNDKTQRILISYPAFPEIYEYDFKRDTLIDTHNIECSKIDKFSAPSKKNIPSEEVRYFFLTNGLYHEIIYDQYRDIYYRFVSLPVPEFKKSIQKPPFIHKPYVIMVLDNQFNILVEKEFPQYRFNVKDWFITKEGLWLSNNNPYNSIFNENKISFTLLAVENNE